MAHRERYRRLYYALFLAAGALWTWAALTDTPIRAFVRFWYGG